MSKASRSITEVDVVAFWRAVELLSPQEIPKPGEDRVWGVGDAVLPWEDERNKKGLMRSQTLQHDVFVGVYSLDAAYTELHEGLGYPEETNDDPPPAGESALAAFTVADDGRVILGSQVLSSCAWAIGRAFHDSAGSRGWLEGFERATAEFRDSFEDLVSDGDSEKDGESDEDGAGPVVDKALLTGIGEVVAEQLACDGAQVSTVIRDAVEIRVRSRVVGTVNRYRATERNFLNSFIARDLETVAGALGNDAHGSALARYLASAAGIEGDATGRINVEKELDYVRWALQPRLIPLGRWPSSATAPADLGQQLAVNMIVGRSRDDEFGGLVAVNGPPGTGKTTMLRDVIAALVVERARRLAKLETPDAGFDPVPIKLRAGKYQRKVHELIPKLQGFEMVLACATNAAAENVTTEIPLRDAIAPEWHDHAGYFTATATGVLNARRNGDTKQDGVEAWGLIAARLGSLSRCKPFATAFWFETDAADANHAGLLQILKNHKAAPEAWDEAVTDFRAALKRAKDGRDARHEYARLFFDRERAELNAADYAVKKKNATAQLEQARREHDHQQQELVRCKSAHDTRLAEREAHRALRPSLWQTLCSFGRALKEWRSQDEALAEQATEATKTLTTATQRQAQIAATITEHAELARSHEAREAEERARIAELEREIAAAGEQWEERFPGAVFPDDEWAQPSQRARRELQAPWIDEGWNGARTELFLAALRLHEAFVLANASKMVSSLGVAMDVIQGSPRTEITAAAALAAWQCLFMVVPVISTTFASYPRLFRRLGREALGWVLIDEAGQSTPQNAAGPIWRSRTAVVIGDPLQLEPIVTLPLGTQRDLAQAHGVAEALLPSHTSLQTLADNATHLGTYRSENVWVGAPLNVHRRCEEPMFAAVNELAYDGQMIDHTPERDECPFPPSAWLHVTAERSQGHWIAGEGERLTQLLEELAGVARRHGQHATQAFLIAPFRDVANKLRGYREDPLAITSGTIHTAQGREADIVIIVLGGDTRRTRDKQWAAEKPNLLNVAVSRARRRLYVIGDHDVWSPHAHFKTLAKHLPVGS